MTTTKEYEEWSAFAYRYVARGVEWADDEPNTVWYVTDTSLVGVLNSVTAKAVAHQDWIFEIQKESIETVEFEDDELGLVLDVEFETVGLHEVAVTDDGLQLSEYIPY